MQPFKKRIRWKHIFKEEITYINIFCCYCEFLYMRQLHSLSSIISRACNQFWASFLICPPRSVSIIFGIYLEVFMKFFFFLKYKFSLNRNYNARNFQGRSIMPGNTQGCNFIACAGERNCWNWKDSFKFKMGYLSTCTAERIRECDCGRCSDDKRWTNWTLALVPHKRHCNWCRQKCTPSLTMYL